MGDGADHRPLASQPSNMGAVLQVLKAEELAKEHEKVAAGAGAGASAVSLSTQSPRARRVIAKKIAELKMSDDPNGEVKIKYLEDKNKERDPFFGLVDEEVRASAKLDEMREKKQTPKRKTKVHTLEAQLKVIHYLRNLQDRSGDTRVILNAIEDLPERPTEEELGTKESDAPLREMRLTQYRRKLLDLEMNYILQDPAKTEVEQRIEALNKEIGSAKVETEKVYSPDYKPKKRREDPMSTSFTYEDTSGKKHRLKLKFEADIANRQFKCKKMVYNDRRVINMEIPEFQPLIIQLSGFAFDATEKNMKEKFKKIVKPALNIHNHCLELTGTSDCYFPTIDNGKVIASTERLLLTVLETAPKMQKTPLSVQRKKRPSSASSVAGQSFGAGSSGYGASASATGSASTSRHSVHTGRSPKKGSKGRTPGRDGTVPHPDDPPAAGAGRGSGKKPPPRRPHPGRLSDNDSDSV